MTFQLCPHKLNPVACLQCFHQKRQAPQPAPRVTRWGDPQAVIAPPLLQRNVDRALMGHMGTHVGNAAPQGEQDVTPSASTSGQIGVSMAGPSLATPKPKEQPKPDPNAQPMREAHHEASPEPEGDQLWNPAPQRVRADIIDRLPQHPDAVRVRR
jgi:hypothetical protein